MDEIITIDNYESYNIGAKAHRLFEMKKNGIPVPDFICIKHEVSETTIINAVNQYFNSDDFFSVRSSASAEDGTEYSFAGQFETFLNVSRAELCLFVKKCFSSVKSERVKAYCDSVDINFNNIEITVIIQRMISADMSGVIFSSNPQGILNETVIAVGRGTGDNVVEDRTSVTQYYYNISDDVFYYEVQCDSPLLKMSELKKIIELSEKIKKLYGDYNDIEFSIKNEEVFILQSRPITSINKDKPLIVLDSSNISESYPGVSSPMTISFVKEVYYLVFKSCINRLTKNDGTAEKLDDVLQNMTDSANGRIYYRISGWYDVIKLLPFSKKIIPIWQEMLGVKDTSVSQSAKKVCISTKFKVTASFFQLIIINQRKMNWLNSYFENVYDDYRSKIHKENNPYELLKLYEEIRISLADVWDLTLVNDMYSFIFTGLLKNSLKKSNPQNYSELTNKYISGISDIESMKPLKLLEKISNEIISENQTDKLSKIMDKKTYYEYINESPCKTTMLMREYISAYGDRCPNELKLETKTYRTNPELLTKYLIKSIKNNASINYEKEKLPHLKGIKKIYAEKASKGIMLRERSRLSRGKIFGLVREIILKIAETLKMSNRIEQTYDVFFLTFEELNKAVADKSFLLRDKINARMKQQEIYEKLPAYSRIIFSGNIFNKNPMNINSELLSHENGKIKGIPCSSGIAEGEILLVENVYDCIDAKEKIIVAKMTDPGWVFIITQAKGIISEKGSLLSHTAIISRELKKPAVVGVDKAFEIFKNGDYVRINGGTGKVEFI